jgi:putative SOS response-associated peptidase YedK
MWVHLRNREPFGLAGLWDVWRKPDGKQLESFTIITTEPNELVRPIHNRMPVILRPEDEELWLDASRTSFAKARSLLKPLPAELMDAQTFRQSSTRRTMMGRSVFNLFQTTRYPGPGKCPCCKQY